MNVEEIMRLTGLSWSSVNSYLPYEKVVYGLDEKSVDADRTDIYRLRKRAVAELQKDCSEEKLWWHFKGIRSRR